MLKLIEWFLGLPATGKPPVKARTKKLGAGAYGKGLKVQFDRKRAAHSKARHPLQDDLGAYTLTGGKWKRDPVIYLNAKGVERRGWLRATARRVWVAGVSAQEAS